MKTIKHLMHYESVCGYAEPYDLEFLDTLPEYLREPVKKAFSKYLKKEWDNIKHNPKYIISIQFKLLKESESEV